MTHSNSTPSPSSNLIWHYTTGHHFPRIASSGVILRATAGVPATELPAVWFSLNPVWEKTAAKSWTVDGRFRQLTFDETAAILGLVRIGVDPATAPYDWREFKRLSGVRAGEARRLVRWAYERGASELDWRVSFDEVPREKWLSVQVWAQDHWAEAAPEPFTLFPPVKGGVRRAA